MEEEILKELLECQKRLLETLESIETRMCKLENILTCFSLLIEEDLEEEVLKEPSGIIDFIRLPTSRKETVQAIMKLGRATAKQVAEKTGKSRNVETIYLNDLCRKGHLKKIREGRKVYFCLKRAIEG